jgi:hypothetical protein
MAIDYSGNLFTSEEILRMRESDTYRDNIRIEVRSLIRAVGIHNLLWAIIREMEMVAKQIEGEDDASENELRDASVAAIVSDGIFEVAKEAAIAATGEMD